MTNKKNTFIFNQTNLSDFNFCCFFLILIWYIIIRLIYLNNKYNGKKMNQKKNKIAASVFTIILMGISIIFFQGCEKKYSSKVEGSEHANLTSAPFVPPPIIRNHASKVIIEMETTEITKRLADGVEYHFWTFDNVVPGRFIRVKEGDLIEFHLHNNPNSLMPHNIDLHAVTGPGGGATSSFTAPGHTSVFSFTAINPGLYVYHCAAAPVALHIANGMYGLILVEPEEGLPQVDHEFYVMQSEFYTAGKNGEPGLQAFSQEKAINEEPEYVVFNGSVGSLTGNNALHAKTGETIRIYLGNGGPNLVSSFHVIGEIFDKVYGEGGTIVTQNNVQTTLIPAGGSAIVEFKVQVPGEYVLVDHSVFRAFHKGALGLLEVSGPENKTIYSGKQKDEIYLGSKDRKNTNPFLGYVDYGSTKPLTADNSNKSDNSIENIAALGKNVYKVTCTPCHQADGQGLPNVFPPLANSDYLNKDKERAIHILVNGLSGPVMVNGNEYNGIMPPPNLNSSQIAAVLTYVYSQWGNSGKKVSVDEVEKVKNSVASSK